MLGEKSRSVFPHFQKKKSNANEKDNSYTDQSYLKKGIFSIPAFFMSVSSFF